MFSYSNPGSNLKDQVRFFVGDTMAKEPYLQDEEIVFLLMQCEQSPAAAAILACEAILSKLARSRDETVGSVSIAFSQAYKNYSDRLDSLRGQLAVNGMGGPLYGGASRTQKAIARSNPDWIQPDFTQDMMESRFVSRLVGLRGLVNWNDECS